MKHKYPETRKSGGKRKDRIFRVYMELPPHISEDEMMDYIEDAVIHYREHIAPIPASSFNGDTVVVRRHTKPYG